MSNEEVYQYWRKKLSGEVLDPLCEEVSTCGHEGACWDVVNCLSEILVEPTQDLLKELGGGE